MFEVIPAYRPCTGKDTFDPASGLPQSELVGHLVCTFAYKDIVYRMYVNSGFITDFASIPRLARILYLPTDPRWREASVVHDMLYTCLGTVKLQVLGPKNIWQPAVAQFSREDCDKIYRILTRMTGTSWRDAWIQYYAIRLGGGERWNKRAKQRKKQ